MKKSFTQKNLILRIIPSIFLIVVSIAMGVGVSYAWLSKNTRVEADNVQIFGAQINPRVTVKNGDNTVTYTSGGAIVELGNIELTVPGSYQDVEITVYNAGTQSFTLDKIGLATPTDDEEVARIVGGEKYYLGTQISTKVVSGDISTTAAVYLVQGVTSNDEITAKDIYFYNSPGKITLEPTQSVNFTIRMTLENDANDQNGYKHFGRTGYNGATYVTTGSGISNDVLGKCSRRLFVICNPVNNE